MNKSVPAAALLACLIILLAAASPADVGRGQGKLLTTAAAKHGAKKTSAPPTTSAPVTTLSGAQGGFVPANIPTTTVATTRSAPVTTAAPTQTTLAPTTQPPAAPATTAPAAVATAPVPVPPPPPVASTSTGSMPVGDLPGWRQVFTEDFTTNAPLGAFTSTYGGRWGVYEDGWKDTAAKSEGAPSRYFPSRVLSVQNGVLNKYLHNENGTNMVAAIAPKIGAQLYGRYSVRFRADSAAGYKMAWLLWPKSGVWPGDGEIDFPEGGLNENIFAFMHRQGATNGSDQDAFPTSASLTSWHTATIEWAPSSVVFVLDGQIVGRSTNRVPNTPMEWVLQSETCIGSCQPAPSTVANVEIDWVVAYSYNP